MAYTYLSNSLSTIASSLGSTLVDSSFDSAALDLKLAYSSIALAESIRFYKMSSGTYHEFIVPQN
jgi:hypothetical protein